MNTPDTKDGKLIRATHWCDAGTPVRDIRLTSVHIAMLAKAALAYGATLPEHHESTALEYQELAAMLVALEPDCLNDTTA